MDNENQQTIPPQVPSPEQKSHNNWLRILAIGFGIISIGIAIAAGGYVLGTKNSQPPVEKVVTQPTPVDETANWKTYTNTFTNYEVKYPNNWTVVDRTQNTQPKGYLIAFLDPSGKDKNSAYFYSGGTTARGMECFSVEKSEKIMVAGIEATKEILFPQDSESIKGCEEGYPNTKLVLVDFAKSQEEYISYSLEFYITDGNFLLADQILSTFKFTDPDKIDETANWQTYANPKFTFKYPADKFIVEERTKDYFVVKPIGLISAFEGISIDARTHELDYNSSIEDLKKDLISPIVQNVNYGVKISGKYGPPAEPGMSLEGTETLTAYLKYKDGFIIVGSTDKNVFAYFDQILSTFRFSN